MASVVDPVGPLPRGVYWRRRLIVLVALLIVLAVVSRLFGWWGGSSAPAAAPSPSPSASPTPSSTPTSSPTPTATTKPTASPATKLCTDAQIKVSVSPDKDAYPVGGPVKIRFIVGTTSDTPCRRDVGAAQNEVTITSSSAQVWSSDDCNPGGTPDLRTLSKGQSYVATVTWNGSISKPNCPTGQPKAPAGTYSITGRNGDVKSTKSDFTLG